MRMTLNPKPIWCLPLTQLKSSPKGKLLTLKCPGAQVPQKVVKPPVMPEIRMKFGTALYIFAPRSVQLIGKSVGPRLSRRRLKLKWKVLTTVGPNVYVSPMVASCASSKFPGEVVVNKFCPIKTGGLVQRSQKYRP